MNKVSLSLIFSILFTLGFAQEKQLIDKLNILPEIGNKTFSDTDWLLSPGYYKAGVYRDPQSDLLVLSNGLVERRLTIIPNGATVACDLSIQNIPFFRAVKPEAQITVDGKTVDIGGLTGQPIQNYFQKKWITDLKSNPASMQLVDFNISSIEKRFDWKRHSEWMSSDPDWPPKGVSLHMTYSYKNRHRETITKLYGNKLAKLLFNTEVTVHYNMYDGIPLVSKWITISNANKESLTLEHFVSELFAFIEPESSVGDLIHWKHPNFTIETDYAFGGGMNTEGGLNKSYFYKNDDGYETIINYNKKQPSMMIVEPAIGPGLEIKPGDTFESYRVFELFHGSYDRERIGLAVRKMYRTLAPWVMENPVLMHVRNSNNKAVKLAIDQCAEVGFEMVIMTFGSGFNLEDSSRKNIERMKALADYAHSKGVALGGYSLLASRSIDKVNDVLMPEGEKPTFLKSPCLQSKWGQKYFKNLYRFYDETSLDILEHDGSYPGDPCISFYHPGHIGYEDSQWKQLKRITDFYKWCRSKGIYLNVPDWYFLNGSNKIAMGYRETNWSLPREYQEIIERQNVYDGTWEKTPSMGWMFVPLVQYHGGGKEATIEPLKDHLDHYNQRLANLFGAGVQACYRGPRLYDSDETRKVVKKWVDFYKDHREILDADIVHIRRPDGNDYDGLLHVNPLGNEKGLLMLYNPLEIAIEKTINVGLYYTGLKDKALVSKEGGDFVLMELDNSQNLQIGLNIPARGISWFIFK